MAFRFNESDQCLGAGQYDPEFKAAVCADIDRLQQLPPNWDQFGAPAIRRDVIESAKRVIHALPKNLAFRPSVVPMPNGTLQIEWYGEDRKTLELEFEEDARTIRYLQWDPANDFEFEATCSVNNTAGIAELVHWFMTGLCV